MSYRDEADKDDWLNYCALVNLMSRAVFTKLSTIGSCWRVWETLFDQMGHSECVASLRLCIFSHPVHNISGILEKMYLISHDIYSIHVQVL